MKHPIKTWLQTVALALALTLPASAVRAGSLVIGASGAGSIDGLYLGNTNLGPGNDNFYGFGALTVDQFDPTLELEEFLIDPLDSLGELRLSTLTLGLDIASENQLTLTALSRIETLTYLEIDHEHAGLVDFATNQEATVSVVWTASPYASAQIRDNFNTVLWTSDTPTAGFAVQSSLYFIDYQLLSRWRADSPGISHPEDTLSLQLIFNPQTPPPPPPPPNPPPNPTPVPEPTTLAIWSTILAFAFRKRPRDFLKCIA
jgi:hypothetical protein